MEKRVYLIDLIDTASYAYGELVEEEAEGLLDSLEEFASGVHGVLERNNDAPLLADSRWGRAVEAAFQLERYNHGLPCNVDFLHHVAKDVGLELAEELDDVEIGKPDFWEKVRSLFGRYLWEEACPDTDEVIFYRLGPIAGVLQYKRQYPCWGLAELLFAEGYLETFDT